jgi:hypothetical protein
MINNLAELKYVGGYPTVETIQTWKPNDIVKV